MSLGVDAQTGVFMLLYVDLAYAAARQAGCLRSVADLRQVVLDGAAKRIRPKLVAIPIKAYAEVTLPNFGSQQETGFPAMSQPE
jgi:Cu/Ag efflux pump CusA